jgi:hypothetical protein
VAFGSAIDGWAFRVDQFADMYALKLGAKPAALRRALWGDYHFAAREKRVVRIRHKGDMHKTKPMFVQFALEPIWKVRPPARRGAWLSGPHVLSLLAHILSRGPPCEHSVTATLWQPVYLDTAVASVTAVGRASAGRGLFTAQMPATGCSAAFETGVPARGFSMSGCAGQLWHGLQLA